MGFGRALAAAGRSPENQREKDYGESDGAAIHLDIVDGSKQRLNPVSDGPRRRVG
jgi:hypothetical protein